MRRKSAVVLVFGLLMSGLYLACTTNNINLPTTNTNTNQQSTGGALPTVRPTPGAEGLVKPASVRVGIFAQSCSSGTVPDNAQNAIRVGCVAILTATPRHANGTDMTEEEHGPNVQWTVTGAACQDLDAGGQNATNQFNRAVRGLSVGTCSVCATVQGVQGCAVQTPGGEPAVRVIS